jgi:hypothetical protein
MILLHNSAMGRSGGADHAPRKLGLFSDVMHPPTAFPEAFGADNECSHPGSIDRFASFRFGIDDFPLTQEGSRLRGCPFRSSFTLPAVPLQIRVFF